MSVRYQIWFSAAGMLWRGPVYKTRREANECLASLQRRGKTAFYWPFLADGGQA